MSVLMIDDDPIFCQSAKTFFAAKGLNLGIITDPQVVGQLDLDRVCLFLLDIDMPSMNGADVLQLIRKKSEVTVIMISGQDDRDTRLRFLSNGADFFFAKPVDLDELRLVCARALGRQLDSTTESAVWKLSRARMEIVTPTGNRHGLSLYEYRVLEVLFQTAPEPVSREQLITQGIHASRPPADGGRALEVMLSRIRSRVSNEQHKLPIKSIRNSGYVFLGHAALE